MRLLAFVAAIVVTGCAARGGGAPPVIAASRAAALPSLSYRLVSGPSWTSDAARGRVMVLDVWATYCKPCRKAFPKLGRLAATHPDVVVIGISVDDDDAVVDAFLHEVPAGFPIARDPEHTVQSGPLAIQALPTVLVVDRRGRIRFRADKMSESDYDVLPGVVDALLAE
jgi:thiol-disulfide isomerase/thioredoxin